MDPAALSALARHSEAVATARAFAEAAGALRVVLVLDDPEGAVLVDHAHDTEITEGDAVATIPAGTAVPAPAKPLPEVRRAPASAISLDLEAGEIAAPIGVIEHLAEAVEALARAFGGRTVATAEFPTRDAELPITLAAREGEPTLLAAGEQEFELRGG